MDHGLGNEAGHVPHFIGNCIPLPNNSIEDFSGIGNYGKKAIGFEFYQSFQQFRGLANVKIYLCRSRTPFRCPVVPEVK